MQEKFCRLALFLCLHNKESGDSFACVIQASRLNQTAEHGKQAGVAKAVTGVLRGLSPCVGGVAARIALRAVRRISAAGRACASAATAAVAGIAAVSG